MSKIITLCSDFGLRDGYVAAMKGVILGIAPDARLVDITHDLPRGDVQEAAFTLWSAYRFFPRGTVHLVVVDPGVGSDRRAIAVRTEGHLFVAPDNGVLDYSLRQEPMLGAVALTHRAYWRTPEVSRTFHGRDIFAPAAAHLANGVPLTDLGDAIQGLVSLDHPSPVVQGDGSIDGHVIHVDRFGNLVTDIPAVMLAERRDWRIIIGRESVCGLRETYASVGSGELLALIGSLGHLEIAVRDGDARQATGGDVGATVQLK